MAADRLYNIAYDEAVRALSEQQAVVESFRTRAGLLFSAAAVTTSFLGAQVFQGGNSIFASWLALLCFIAVAVAALSVLWPRTWEGAASPREVIDAYIELAEIASVEELHRDLSIFLHRSYLENRVGLRQLAALLQVASGLLTIEVALWIVAMAGTA
jgi:hypothetical protein